jgi:predicted Zn finger-like uncharacterized protein
MKSAVGLHATRCPRCDADLDYRLDVADGGGLRYDVSCSSCGHVVYEFCTPLVDFRAAA